MLDIYQVIRLGRTLSMYSESKCLSEHNWGESTSKEPGSELASAKNLSYLGLAARRKKLTFPTLLTFDFTSIYHLLNCGDFLRRYNLLVYGRVLYPWLLCTIISAYYYA